jgi:hypothetical protein
MARAFWLVPAFAIAATGMFGILDGRAPGNLWAMDGNQKNGGGGLPVISSRQPPMVFPNFFESICNVSAFEFRTADRNLELVIKSLGSKVNVHRRGPVMVMRVEDKECPRRYKITVEIDDEMRK